MVQFIKKELPKCDISLLDKPRIWVDFNTPFLDILILPNADIITNSNGEEIYLEVGKILSVFDFDVDENNQPDNLLANGMVILNKTNHYTNFKWLLKIIPHPIFGKYYWVSDTKQLKNV